MINSVPVVSNKSLTVRLASTRDVACIQAIDSSATRKYGGIPELEDLATNQEPLEKVQEWLQLGRVYLVEDSQKPVGFVAAHMVDIAVLYIDEIAVLLEHQGQGMGAMLLSAVFEWAMEELGDNGNHCARVSLITYADVPWNGPWYRKHGFKEVKPEIIGPWHVDKMTVDAEERDLVRPGYRRCCMLWETKASWNRP